MKDVPGKSSGGGGISGDRLRPILLLVLLGGHLVWVFSHFAAAYVGPDAGGLFVQARLKESFGRHRALGFREGFGAAAV